MKTLLVFLAITIVVKCRDYYVGKFSRGDFLVAQDNVFKERRPFGRVKASYGRLFKCKITYFRVVDRLGMGTGPVVKVLKGGLQKNYVGIRIRSGYNLPVSVNIYVGCQNENLKHFIPPFRPPMKQTTKPTSSSSTTTTAAPNNEPKITTDVPSITTNVPSIESTTATTTGTLTTTTVPKKDEGNKEPPGK